MEAHGLAVLESPDVRERDVERPAGDPRRTDVHDFPAEQGKAVPYGVYDLAADTGWVSVSSDGDTAAAKRVAEEVAAEIRRLAPQFAVERPDAFRKFASLDDKAINKLLEDLGDE